MNRLQRLKKGDWFEYLPFFAVVLGPLALFLPDFLRGRALFWGTPMLQFVPWRTYALELLRAGHLPLWNDLLGMGAPLLANYQSALLYPPNALLILTGSAWGHGLLVMIHLIWTGLGTVALARRLDLNPLGQAGAGMAFSLSGYLVARAGFLSINATAAWLPWVILAVDRLNEALRRQASAAQTAGAIVLLGFFLAMQWLGGHAQTAWYSLVLALAWASWRAFKHKGFQGVLKIGAFLGAAGISAFLLASAQLLPTLEYLAQSQRMGALDETFALTYSFWPWRLSTLIAPNLFGNPASGEFWGYGNYWEDAIYIGVIPFLLACRAVWRGMRGTSKNTSLIRFALVAALLAFLLALGDNTPIYPFLFRHIPTFGLFQAPTRWNLIGVFVLALLAGVGADSWGRPSERGLYWSRLGMAGAAVVGVAAWIASRLWLDIEPSFVSAFSRLGLWLFLFGGLNLLHPGRKDHHGWSVAVTGLVLINLVWLGAGLNPTVDIAVFEGRSRLVEDVGTDHRSYMPPDVVYQVKFHQTFRFDRFLDDFDWRYVRDIGLPNTTVLDHMPSANNFDPMLPARYTVWMDQLERLTADRRQALLRLMDVGWTAEKQGQIRYTEIQDPNRVRLIHHATFVDTDHEARSRIAAQEFDPEREIVLVGEPERIHGAEAGSGSAEIVGTEGASEIMIHVRTSAGGWLLLSDTWYPGWRANVDGQSSKIYRADGLFRAVWVPVGAHQVVFRYRPVSFALGVVLSALAWLVLIGFTWRRRPR
jgi:hypothetical protein